MRSYSNKMTAIAATALFLAGLTAASHPTPMSHNTSEFKAVYESTGVVPEVVAGIDPATSFYFGYLEADGDKAMLMPGDIISLSEAQQLPFEWTVEGLSNVTNVTDATRYLVYIADVDSPDRNSSTAGNLRHYLAGNLTVTGPSELLETAVKLSTNSTPFTEFVNPNPQVGTGVHRFLSALYVQPARFNTAGFETTDMETVRSDWNLSEWRTQLGLGPAIGATVYMINTTDDGTLSAAPGLSANSWSTMAGVLSTVMFCAFSLL